MYAVFYFRPDIRVPAIARELLGKTAFDRKPNRLKMDLKALDKIGKNCFQEETEKDSNDTPTEDSSKQMKDEVKKQLFNAQQMDTNPASNSSETDVICMDSDLKTEMLDIKQEPSSSQCKVVIFNPSKENIQTTGEAAVVTLLPNEDVKPVSLDTPVKSTTNSNPSKEDSGYVTHTNSEEVNAGSNAETVDIDTANMDTESTKIDPESTKMDSESIEMDSESSKTDSETKLAMESTETDSIPESTKQDGEHTSIKSLVSDKLPKLKGVMPRLSGGPDNFVDLEDGEDKAPKEVKPGVTALMQRLMKHSTRKTRKAKDVIVR